MILSVTDIAKMIDLSCVRITSSKQDIDEMVASARKYNFGQVSVMQCFIPYTKQLLKDDSAIHVVGNVSFPWITTTDQAVRLFSTRICSCWFATVGINNMSPR